MHGKTTSCDNRFPLLKGLSTNLNGLGTPPECPTSCRAGVSPVIWNVFVSLPLNATTISYMQSTLPQIAAAKAICMLTVMPDQGLAAVTPATVQELATYITTYEKVPPPSPPPSPLNLFQRSAQSSTCGLFLAICPLHSDQPLALGRGGGVQCVHLAFSIFYPITQHVLRSPQHQRQHS